jgi:hypothetical protein
LLKIKAIRKRRFNLIWLQVVYMVKRHVRPAAYLPGGEVLKLLRIKSHRKKRIKAVSSFIVNKLPHKDAMV